MSGIGFIGTGNMGYAILKGLMSKHPEQQVVVTDVDKLKVKTVADEFGILTAESNKSCVQQSKYILLAVKPQYYDGILAEIREDITPDHVIITIAPGITISTIQQKTGGAARVVRAMPNTPALLGEGMTGVSYEADLFSEDEVTTIHMLFKAFGKMKVVEERLMNAVVCVSGSSPAYMYLFIEALADSAVRYGLPRDTAYEMAAQTMLGSAKMILETGEHPGKLKDQVCSPGGTTIAAVAALEEHGFRNAIMKATDACYHRAEELK